MPETRLHTCMLCEAVCGVSVELDGQRVVSVRGDKEDPFSRGHVCPKVAAIADVMNDADRIRQPMRRDGDRWVPISWPAALEEAGQRLAAVQKRFGRNSLGMYFGNPTVHSISASLAAIVFSRALHTRSRFSATSVDQLPQMLAALKMFGHQLLLPVPDVDRTHHFLILGANPLASNGSLMTAGDIRSRLAALKKRGAKLVVVDPRRSETAAIADAHHFISPGGDAPLLLGMLQVIFAEGLAKPGRLAQMTSGFEQLAEVVKGYPPERVAGRSGLSPEAIRTLARDFAQAQSAVCYGRVGASTQEFGGLASWLVNALNIVTGNFDRAGGAMFTSPAADVVALSGRTGDRGGFGRWRSRVRGLPEFGGELPAAVMAEEMDTGGDGQLKALITFAGNPALSAPNGPRLERALSGLEYMVSIDIYRNETTKHAHLILPTSFGFERPAYDAVFYALAVRNVARWAPAIVKPPPGVREDWEVLFDLALSLRKHGGGRKGLGQALTLRAARALGPWKALDLLLRAGPRHLSLRTLAKSPHGIDLGPLEPCLPSRLQTGDRKVCLVPELYQADLRRLDATLVVPAQTDQLLLIGRRQLRSNNSWMHNSQRLVKGPPACTLLIHPDDAISRGLKAGQTVVVRSRVGEVVVPLEVTEDIAPGVVSLPHGWGHTRDGVALSTAARTPGASINDLTDELRVDVLSGNAAFSGTPVTLSLRSSGEAG